MILRVLNETSTTVKVGWDPVPNANGFRFFRDAIPVASTFDGTKTSVTFSKPDALPHTYGVKAFSYVTSGEIVVPVPPEPPVGYDPRTAWLAPPWTSVLGPEDPNSAALIAAWVAHGGTKDGNGNLYSIVCTNSYSTAWAKGRASDPTHDITVSPYGARIIHGVHIPNGTQSTSGDGHLTIFDLVTNRVYEMFAASLTNGQWSCRKCAEYPLAATDPGVGGTASNIPAWGVSIWPEEIGVGHIGHALGFSIVSRQAGQGAAPGKWRYPATSTDGRGTPTDLWEGMRLAFPASLVPSSAWPAPARTIFRALQEFGMFLVDQGGVLGLAGVNPINGGLSWSAVGMGTGGTYRLPADFPWDKMRVLQAPARP